MAVIIGSARHDENGKYSGGAVGDSLQKINSTGFDTKGEVSSQNFYVHSKGWVILRPKDANFANALAFCMAVACINENIGYDQSNRLGAYKHGIDTKVKTETDCSGLVRACIKQCGHSISDFNTATEANVLVSSGLFEKVAFTKESDLYVGDVLVTKSKGHTVIVIANAKARTTKAQNPYAEPTSNLKKGSKGEDVKWLQFELNESGAKLTVDGIFGNGTLTAVKAYQKAHGLTVDGIVGANTRNSLKSN